MTPSELKYNVEKTGSCFFERSSMRFFGDTMRNYGVRDVGDCWELYRKHAVNGGLKNSSFFDKATFGRVFKNED